MLCINLGSDKCGYDQSKESVAMNLNFFKALALFVKSTLD